MAAKTTEAPEQVEAEPTPRRRRPKGTTEEKAPKEDMGRLQLTLPKSVIKRLKHWAIYHELTESQIVAELIEERLKAVVVQYRTGIRACVDGSQGEAAA